LTGLALRRISKAFGGNQILQDVTIEAAPGEFIALVGPSGCGKTTLLRIAAGLEHADTGSVQLGDRDITALRPAARDIAMVFQSYALYPHLTAGQNIAVPLAMRRLSTSQRLPFIGNLMPGQRALRAEIQASVRETAASLKIDHLLDRKPGQMSGGQRQRVALARALVRRPAAFLMDEPLSNLDANLRVHTRGEIVELHRRAGVTTLYVTHDQSEALSMADRVALMIGGRLLQLDTPSRIYADPAHVEVARFIGSPRINLLTTVLDETRAGRIGGRVLVDGVEAMPGTAVTLGVRPEALRFLMPGQPGLTATVRRLEFLGSELLVFLTLADGAELVAKTAPALAAELAPGSSATLAVDAADILVFGPEGRRLPVEPATLRIAAHG
jgi:multiple sugar transport system ATP-binding protein